METAACLAAIRNHYNTLTRLERRLADYILGNSASVVTMSVAALSEASGVAGSAVIRFCKTMGYTGFSQFRLTLAMELASRPAQIMPSLHSTDTAREIADKVFDCSIRTLRNTISLLDFPILDKLVDTIMHADRICIFGVGTSSPVAEDAEYRFLQLGYPASSYKDILFMPIAALNMKKGEVAIAVSHSGRTTATLEALQLAGEQGASTVAITSYCKSPLAEIADFPLIAYPDDSNYPVEAVSARLAHMCILDTLSVILTMRGGSNASGHLQNRDIILEKIRAKKDE